MRGECVILRVVLCYIVYFVNQNGFFLHFLLFFIIIIIVIINIIYSEGKTFRPGRDHKFSRDPRVGRVYACSATVHRHVHL